MRLKAKVLSIFIRHFECLYTILSVLMLDTPMVQGCSPVPVKVSAKVTKLSILTILPSAKASLITALIDTSTLKQSPCVKLDRLEIISATRAKSIIPLLTAQG